MAITQVKSMSIFERVSEILESAFAKHKQLTQLILAIVVLVILIYFSVATIFNNQSLNKKLIKVKVWERGAGLTKACGTAACATAVAANINELTDKTTDIEFALGRLSISIDENNSIHMKGPVSDIKNIEINI